MLAGLVQPEKLFIGHPVWDIKLLCTVESQCISLQCVGHVFPCYKEHQASLVSMQAAQGVLMAVATMSRGCELTHTS